MGEEKRINIVLNPLYTLFHLIFTICNQIIRIIFIGKKMHNLSIILDYESFAPVW